MSEKLLPVPQGRVAVAFPLLAAVLFLFFFSASAPSPLFIVFQGRWGFSSGMLTVAFSIYSLVLLTALLVAGSLSDHLGRRPVVVTALLIQVAAMTLFLMARGINGLLVARIMQGLSMGVVNGALSAAVIEAAPLDRKWLGTLVTSMSPLAGLATGALATGVLIGLTADADTWMFGTLTAVFLACALLVLLVPETVSRRPGVFASMVPRISVATRARRGFVHGLPLLLAIWALCGFVIALGPSLMRAVFMVDSGRLNGLTVAVLCGAGAVSPLPLRPLRPAWTVVVGMVAVTSGLVILLASLSAGSLTLFFLGDAVAGAGLGAAFAGLIQSLVPLTGAHERAELFAAIFVATYLSLSLPPVLAGFLIPLLGFLQTAKFYLAAVLVIAVTGTAFQWSIARPERASA
jgi:MFS family permease